LFLLSCARSLYALVLALVRMRPLNIPDRC
jgi:hypothetical protein